MREWRAEQWREAIWKKELFDGGQKLAETAGEEMELRLMGEEERAEDQTMKEEQGVQRGLEDKGPYFQLVLLKKEGNETEKLRVKVRVLEGRLHAFCSGTMRREGHRRLLRTRVEGLEVGKWRLVVQGRDREKQATPWRRPGWRAQFVGQRVVLS